MGGGGEIGLLPRILDDGGEIEVADGEIALDGLIRRMRSATNWPVSCPADDRRFSSTARRSRGPSTLTSNCGCSVMSASIGRTRAISAKRNFVGRHPQVEDRRREVVLDAAVDRQRRLVGPKRQPLDIQRIVAERNAARERVHGNRRLRSSKRQVCDLDRVVHRFVLERQLRIEPIEAIRNVHARRADRAIDDDRPVADADAVDGDGSRWDPRDRLPSAAA